ncbi:MULTISPECIES: universal stress protein [Hydrogenophaga]|uniref:Universal stress protein UspA-like protein n=1 Tax=Hydrogenophaga intermedia TaxID=65786 RepID=A0A1L1PSQ8_HYDIT|nr:MULTISPECIES: universal stress protein [Hydrogenophaga]AOS80049.1 universal stress protein UspA [Hydrogenophaga sp. PBC]TMU71477.1 universal stress protein [Hydrogenophaga intermedia]CDN89086.1 Universal stress protein UspA-like protein [Hydrogenophaga intermedia]
MKILLAVDGSEHTRRALAYLAAHDEWLGARHAYTVVHAATALPHRAAAFHGLDVARSFYEDDAQVIFKPVRQFLGMHGIQAKFVLRIGHPAKHIAALAKNGRFDLLIMGTHGHGAIAGLFMGSVATKVLSLCATPVLLIR